MLHVQSISEWAPSCIGPYSQATRHSGLALFAGQVRDTWDGCLFGMMGLRELQGPGLLGSSCCSITPTMPAANLPTRLLLTRPLWASSAAASMYSACAASSGAQQLL